MKWLPQLSVFLVVALMRVGVFAAPAVTNLTDNRILLFDDYASSNTAVLVGQPWTLHAGPMAGTFAWQKALLPGTNHFHRSGWRLLSCRSGTIAAKSGARSIPPLVSVPVYPLIASNLAANLRNDLGATLDSPVFTNGVGTLYFEAINAETAYPTEIAVDISTNMWDTVGATNVYTVLPSSTNNLEFVWRTISTNDLNAATANDFIRYVKRLNIRVPSKVRIRRSEYVRPVSGSNLDSAFTVVDNVRVSPPPTDVVIYDVSAFKQSGNYVIRCFVDNADTNAPTDSRTVTGYYRWADMLPPDNAWSNAPMTLVAGPAQGDGARYELVLPPHVQGGNLEYYVVCSFGGTVYQSPDYTGLGYSYPSEALSPFTLPVQTQYLAGAAMYTLTVNSGSGGGSYTNGSQVAVTADTLVGKGFERWTGATQYLANASAPTTIVTMPESDVEISAAYTNNYFTLTVSGGSGGGSFMYDQTVPITAQVLAGKIFDRWTGATQYVANVASSNTTVTMPAENIAVAATYIDVYTLTVSGGSGGGTYTNGQQVAITADAPPAGKVFYRWTGDTAYVASATSASTTVTMPGANIALTATYIDVYTLTVSGGSGGGAYTNGSQVAITAAAPPAGKAFYRWTGDTAYVASVTSASTTVTMPAANIALTATYINVYTLTVNSGTGGGSYPNGAQVAITASNPAVGKVFARWTGATQYVASATSPATTVTMPAANIALTATYSNLYYTLTVSGGTGSGAYTNGQVVAIAAVVPSGKTFDRWSGDTATVANSALPSTTVTIPAFNIALSALFSSRTSVLPDGRILDFNDYAASNTAVLVGQPWTLHDGPMMGTFPWHKALLFGTNHYHRTGWQLISCRSGTIELKTGSRIIPPTGTAVYYPAISSNLAANLRNDLGAMLDSPVFTNGVGTLYFEAINAESALPTEIAVDISTNMWDTLTGTNVYTLLPSDTNNLDYVWQTVSVIDLNASTINDFVRYNQRFNFRGPVRFRIRRSGVSRPVYAGGLDSAFTVIDNIRVSLPPSDVVISKNEAPFEPGFPSVGTNIVVRCQVSNAATNVPTDSRTPMVVYRWRFLNQVVQPWRTNILEYVTGTGDGQGNGEVYQGTLSRSPYSDVGDLEYYFLCEYGGYEYVSLDYTGMNYVYPSESLSPKPLRGDGSGGELTVRLRPYASRYDKIYVVADTNQFAAPIAMTLVGDHEWQGAVPIAGTGITNLVWRFRAEGEYLPGSGAISTNITYWAGVSGVSGGLVPYGGTCVETNESGQLNVRVDKGNYVLVTLNTETLQYLATRGEYQNFNAWPAPLYTFSESNGQDPKTSYLNTFDTWPVNEDQIYKQSFAGYPTSTNVFMHGPFFTLNPEFVAGGAAYVSERTLGDNTDNAPTNVLKFRNVAMRLKGGDPVLGLGYIHNRVATLPDGLKEVTFKARIAQTSDNADICYYRNGFTNKNYMVKAYPRAVSPTSLSPQNPSLSLVGYYTDMDNFYEYRVVQINDADDSAGSIQDRRVSHQLYKWKNGVATLLATPVIQDTVSSPLVQGYLMELAFFNEATGTRIKCRYASSDKINVVESYANGPHTSGTFGYYSSDCASSLSEVLTLATVTGGGVTAGSEIYYLRSDVNFSDDVIDWYLPAGQYVPNAGVTPKGIYSVIPVQQIGVYVQPTTYGSDVEPESAGSLAWQKIQTVTVNDFSYQTVTFPLKTWQSQFVMLQAQGGSEDVAVDEISVSSWHGKRNGLGWADVYEWVAYESWVTTNTPSLGNTVQLDHSRGNPAVDQAIRALALDNGMGLMEFDYQVLRAPARLKVQYAPKRDVNDWTDVESFTVSNAVGWTHASAYLGTNAPGFFRVLNAREGIFTNAWVEINNATVWDEPTVTNNSWRAYNVKITATDTNRVALDESKACFLNNSTTLETDPPQTEFEPFLRSPELPRGLGKLSFMARAYTNNQAATLFVYASTNGWDAPTNLWFELTRFDNITNGLYWSFSYEPQDGRNIDAIKFGTKTRSFDRRVCIEDVTISEPVFPGFTIAYVQTMALGADDEYVVRSQPLEGEDIHVQARLDNIQMVPSNIVVNLSYYVGTNTWGIGNWPAGEWVTRRMTNNVPGDPTLYRTVPGGTPGFPVAQTGGIPGQNRDQVVQYYVWAEYDGGIHLREQQETFENPPWYYPVDLNARYAQQGWSPYYFVYSVPEDAVWINEVNGVDYMESGGNQIYGIWDNAYIEIAVPVWLSLAGWSVDIVKNDYQVETILIRDPLPEQTASTNGYAFFVIGDEPSMESGVPSINPDFVYPGLKASLPRIIPGGLRLKRPLGMYEQSAAYDWTNGWGGVYSGELWAADDPHKRLVYVGQENSGGSLGVTNGAGLTFSDWVFPMSWTPGSPNVGQVVPDGTGLVPGLSNIVVTSLLNLDKATQNGKRVTYYSLRMQKGTGTNIVYQTDPWYRLFSVKKDQVEQLPSVGTATNFNLVLSDVQDNIGIDVDVRLRQDLADMGLDQETLNWVLSFQDGELIPMYYNDKLLTLTEQYWIDAPPTQSNTFELAITKFTLDPSTNFHVTVRMVLNGEKKSSLQGPAVLKLQSKSRLLDTQWDMLAQYSLTAASFDENNTCRVYVPNPFDLILSGVDPESLYFRWVIDTNDPRVSIQTLTNVPEP